MKGKLDTLMEDEIAKYYFKPDDPHTKAMMDPLQWSKVSYAHTQGWIYGYGQLVFSITCTGYLSFQKYAIPTSLPKQATSK